MLAGTLGWVLKKASTMNDKQDRIQKEFYEAFPLCFPEAPRCGFYVGEGWIPMLKELCANIEVELKKLPENLRNFHVDQVKEKFAGLRFYYSGPNPDDGVIEVEVSEEVIQKLAYENWQWRVERDIKGSAEYDWIRAENSAYVQATLKAYPQELKDARKRIEELISEAEEASFKICEGCGKPGTVRGESWVRTQCDECEKEMKRQRALDDRKQ